jgi:hypothetical protein
MKWKFIIIILKSIDTINHIKLWILCKFYYYKYYIFKYINKQLDKITPTPVITESQKKKIKEIEKHIIQEFNKKIEKTQQQEFNKKMEKEAKELIEKQQEDKKKRNE